MRVEVLWAAGRSDEVRAELDRLVATGFAEVSPPEQPHSFATLAGVVAAVDHPQADRAARALRERLEPWSGLIVYDGVGGVLPAVDLYLGRLASRLGDEIAAHRYLAAARARHERFGSPLLLADSDRAEPPTSGG
jgi:hypothetical protein